MAPRATLAAALAFSLSTVIYSCRINGYESGECLSVSQYRQALDYCQDVVTYPSACMPIFNPLFPNHSIQAKDAWVRSTVETMIETRIAIENNSSCAFGPRPSARLPLPLRPTSHPVGNGRSFAF